MPALTIEYIKHVTGEFDEETVFQAVLADKSISRIEAINKCCNLRWLDLSNNQIIRMENLDGLSQLVSVDLSFNKITKVQSLEGMPSLERLMLKANPIARIQDIEGLQAAQKLRHLQFQNIDSSDFCPVCLQPEYQKRVRELCPDLVALDSKRWHLPDIDREIRRLDDKSAIDVPGPEPWFTPKDLETDDLHSQEAFDLALKSDVQDYEAAMADCKSALQEAEELLRQQAE
mmetsp:Transcript_86956/g.156634  ORF Transcript_86956/g.156634 Transcript_86956/m.156634 type:complete len:231 (+) Transcript_86956:61-753(+)